MPGAACLVFASANNPGGGFLGATARNQPEHAADVPARSRNAFR
ncbi:poly(ADP-ribose) glycohydrolase domain-containing protein [Micromonospora marina]